MANRQPGHHTFGLRNSTEIMDTVSMFNATFPKQQYQTVYDTTTKQRKTGSFDFAAASPSTFITPSQVYLNGSGPYFYTGMVMTAYNAGTGASPAMRPAKGSGDTERPIGVFVGPKGPTAGNNGYQTGILQYSGEAWVLLEIGESVNIRGQYVYVSLSTTGTSSADVSAAIGGYGICTTGATANGVTGGWGPGLTGIGLTGNLVRAFVRPVETN